jgi:hypothetical protein
MAGADGRAGLGCGQGEAGVVDFGQAGFEFAGHGLFYCFVVDLPTNILT